MRWAQPLSAAMRGRVALPFAVTGLIWGSTWLVIRHQLGDVPPSWSVCYRFLVAGLAMLVTAIVTRAPLRLGLRDAGLTAAVGIALFVLNFNFVYRAEAHVTSGLVAVTFALLFVYNAVLGRIFLRQPLSRPFLAGSIVAVAGVALLFAHEMRVGGGNAHEAALGIGYTLVALVFASTGNVLQGARRIRALPMATMLAWSMLIGAAVNAGWAWASAGPPRIDLTPAYLSGLLYLGLVASALAFTLYFQIIRLIGPARAGYVNVMAPVTAMALSTLFEGYRWSAAGVIGAALVVAGLVVALRARSPSR